MEWFQTLIQKSLALYTTSIGFKIAVWLCGVCLVLLSGTVIVQGVVLRKYKRTIYELRATTIQLKAQRDVLTEKLTQAEAQAKIKALQKDASGYASKRAVLLEQIQASKKNSQVLDESLKKKIRVIDDLKIDTLLKNSKELEEALNQTQSIPSTPPTSSLKK